MILRSMRLQNWKTHVDEISLEFNTGFNLICGPNEAGKSTVLDALVRALFDSSRGQREEIRSIQPLGTSLAPEVELEFSASGDDYRIFKRFLKNSTSELSRRADDGWKAIEDGDRAEATVRELAAAGEKGTGRSLTPALRGVAGALWLLQTDELDLPEAWSDRVHHGLNSVLQVAVETRPTATFIARLESRYKELYTETGREKTDGGLSQARIALSRQNERLSELFSREQRAAESRARLAELQAALAVKESALEDARLDLDTQRAAVAGADQHEDDLRVLQDEQREILRIQTAIETTWARLIEQEAEAERNRELNSSTSVSLADAKSREAGLRSTIASTGEEQARIVTDLTRLEARGESLRAAAAARTLVKDEARLSSHLDRVAKSEKRRKALTTELAKLRPPTAEQAAALAILETRIDQLKIAIEASAIRVSFNLRDPDALIHATPTGEPDLSGEYLITEETKFEISEVGVVRVRGGGRAVEDLNWDRNAADLELRSLLAAVNVADTREFRDRVAEAENVRRKIAEVELELQSFAGIESDAVTELERVRAGLVEENSKSIAVADECAALGGAEIRSLIFECETAQKNLRADQRAASGRESNAREELENLLDRIREYELSISAALRSVEVAEREAAAIIREYGSRAAMFSAVQGAANKAELAADKVAKAQESFEDLVLLPRKALGRAETGLQRLESEGAAIKDERSRVAGEIDAIVGDGFYELLGDVEAEFQSLTQRLEVLELRGRALKHLREAVQAKREQQTLTLAQPVLDVVNPWLKHVTGHRYAEVAMGSTLVPEGLRIPGSIKTVAMDGLSCGTREQLVVLTRLALAKLLCGSEPYPVILDDRLINSDPGRRKRMVDVLVSVSEFTQLVVATCNEDLYAGIEGQRIRLAAPGPLVRGRGA
jgi:energy-coupling factor transporter ATP-binding protein EcfA2